MPRTKQTSVRSENRIESRKTIIINRTKTAYNRSVTFIKANPMRSFFIALGLLLLLLIIGKVFQKAPETTTAQNVTKEVAVYGIGESPKAAFQAKVEKSGVIKIIAQSSGIVQSINVTEGDTVYKGQQLISLANNYQGGNAASVQRQIAQAQYQNSLDTFGIQMDLINKQRNVATASAENAQQTRDIARSSVGETGDQINTYQTQLDQVNAAIANLEANNVNGANDKDIAEARGTANQLQAGLNQLRQAQRTTEYQASNDKPPAQLANLQKEIALKQLDVQQKSLELGKEVSRLQVSLAYISEATMYPASPFNGKVERINVREGQNVSSGTVLATITANEVASTAVLLVPRSVAQLLASGEPSELMINNKKIAVTPYHVSTEATDGQMYAVFYDIPEDQQKNLSDGDYININVPISAAKTSSASPLIPIDSVYVSQDNAQILVAAKGKAESRTITLGNVYGSFVEVENGLHHGDQIITNRNVIAGDKVKITQ